MEARIGGLGLGLGLAINGGSLTKQKLSLTS